MPPEILASCGPDLSN